MAEANFQFSEPVVLFPKQSILIVCILTSFSPPPCSHSCASFSFAHTLIPRSGGACCLLGSCPRSYLQQINLRPSCCGAAGLLGQAPCPSGTSQKVALGCPQISHQGQGQGTSGIAWTDLRYWVDRGGPEDCRGKRLGQKRAETWQQQSSSYRLG